MIYSRIYPRIYPRTYPRLYPRIYPRIEEDTKTYPKRFRRCPERLRGDQKWRLRCRTMAGMWFAPWSIPPPHTYPIRHPWPVLDEALFIQGMIYKHVIFDDHLIIKYECVCISCLG